MNTNAHGKSVVRPYTSVLHPMSILGFIGLALMLVSVEAFAVDTDGDGVDDVSDNCTLVANADQRDTNGDQYGNVCDGDLNNNLIVNTLDLGLLRTVLPSGPPLAGLADDADFNGDGSVNTLDLGLMRTFLTKAPGPSCVTNPGGCQAVAQNPTARGDSYATPRRNIGADPGLDVPATRLSGVLYNDFDEQGDPLTAQLVSGPSNGNLVLNADGSFSYDPNVGFTGDDQFTYQASDATNQSTVATVNIRVLTKQTDFKIMMNYELGMHCTGFEFAYCCILPVYNSILAQVVKPEPQTGNIQSAEDMAKLLEGDPNLGRNLDVLGRETVLRDPTLVGAGSGNFPKYVVKYWHDAQSRNDGQGKPQVPGAVPGLPGYLNSTTLISDVEANTLLSWNTRADAITEDVDNKFVLGGAECADPADPSTCAAQLVAQGDGQFDTTGNVFGANVDNFQNAIWNHLYIFEIGAEGVEGARLCVNDTSVLCHDDADCVSVGGVCGDSTEANKSRLGLDVDYPTNFGPGGHPMGPVSGGTFNENEFGAHLTFSGDTGTVVYTQMKLVENLPVTLTSPRIWEALGLPLTPFEDTLGFFNDPGLVDEDSIRPYVQMTAQLHDAVCAADGSCTAGGAVLDGTGHPVQGFGTAPIDIPNCERCHSAFDDGTGTIAPNSPNVTGTPEANLVQLEIDYWMAYYELNPATDADWYARLKGAAISILSGHDLQHGTQFLANFPATGSTTGSTPFDPLNDFGGLTEPLPGAPANCLVNKQPTGPACSAHAQCAGIGDEICDLPQNTRIGHESVICHKCHADSVIAVVKSAECGPAGVGCAQGDLIMPLTEAIHQNHRSVSEGGPIAFNDALGRDGGCQGCHPAHRSDGVMDGYPITLDGNNAQANSDNRLASGGCFVGRDVHSNAMKDIDGAGTNEHLNALGEFLAVNVFRNQAGLAGSAVDERGIWCTNCHSQAGQEMWKKENCPDLVNGDCFPGENPRAAANMDDLATQLGVSRAQLESWADPKDPAVDPLTASGLPRTADETHTIWKGDPGLCQYLVDPTNPAQDGNVATVEVAITSGGAGMVCSTPDQIGPVDCSGVGGPVFNICGSNDVDGDFTVNILDFCTTPDCVTNAQNTLANSAAVAVPMSAASDARDHWLAPGEPHCADCHAAPYVEQSGNINAFAPFNYPRKASLMRYSRGHQDITCQGCHESIHGLYPVTPTIDNTSYAQAASLNHDGSHGPLKCGTCHQVNGEGVPSHIQDGLTYQGQPIVNNYDAAVSWMHTFTAEADPRGDYCLNCHTDNSSDISLTNRTWTEHSYKGRSSREMMDKVEALQLNNVAGDPGEGFVDPTNTVCTSCHGDRSSSLARRGCTEKWRNHLIQGRASEAAWEYMSTTYAGDNCGW